MRRTQQAIALMALLALGACTHEETLPTPPTVTAGSDLTMGVRAVVRLGASATDRDGSIERIDWALVSAPDLAKASVASRGVRGEVVELTTGALPGLYVLSVSATDDDGLTSEPQYVNLTLVPQAQVEVEIVCVDGCDPEAPSPRAGELTTLTLEARATGAEPAGYRWTLAFDRAEGDSLTDEPQLRDLGPQAKVTLPRVALEAKLVATVQAIVVGAPDAAASLEIAVANSVDEPPEVKLEWRRPGEAEPVGALAPKVLPGDALWVTAVASDPNGDPVSCFFPEINSLPAERLEGGDPCRLTLFPLAGGSLAVVARVSSGSPALEADSATLRIAVEPLRLEAAGPSLSAVAVDDTGRALAVGEAEELYLYRDGRRDTFLAPGLTAGTAVAISRGVSPAIGYGGWSTSGNWAALDLDAADPLPSLGWGATAEPPTATRAMAAGRAGRIFAATDRGLAIRDGEGLSRWPSSGAQPTRAVAVGPAREEADGIWVWYAAGETIYSLVGEQPSGWGSPTEALRVEGAEITALSVGPRDLADVWAGTGAAGAGATGRGLMLFSRVLDVASGTVTLTEEEAWFAELGTVGSVAVEQQGPYAGDAWAVAGERLVRVSRAPVNDPAGGRAAVGLELQGIESTVRAVAAGGGAERKVVVASDEGLLSAP